MPRAIPRLAQVGLLCVLAGAVGCPNVLGPVLTVSPLAFSFNATLSSDVFNIANSGGGILTWSIGTPPPWLTLSRTSGSLASTGLQPITMTVNRAGLTPGTHTGEFQITSNGGQRTVSIAVSVAGPPTPALTVSPGSLSFGAADTSRTFGVRNAGTGTLVWTVTDDQPWLTVNPASGTSSGETDTVTVTVDRTGLAPQDYTATITITSDAGTATVAVTMTVAGPTPRLELTPASLSFGATGSSAELTITNSGTGTLHWDLTKDVDWLTLSQVSGATTTTPARITVTLNRAGLPFQDFTGTITVTSNAGSATVSVTMTVKAPELLVTPLVLDFGTFAADKLFTVGNGGTGAVIWNIDMSGFPGWLSILNPVPPSGTVTDTPSGVLVHVNRSGLPPNFSDSFNIVVTSNAGSKTVRVNMAVAPRPELRIETSETTTGGIPVVGLGENATTASFTIRNSGTGSLNWEVNPSPAGPPQGPGPIPSWLQVAPLAGSITTQTNTVTVTVNRAGLPAGGYTYDLPVQSNGGATIVQINMAVAKRASIGTDISSLNFGLDGDAGEFFVANFGDDGTTLRFFVESDKSWLFRSPGAGSSIGVATPPPFKDFRQISLSVDRGGLDGITSTGILTISGEDDQGTVASRKVTVTVEANPLSFELPLARTRVPSIVKFIFMLRDFQNKALVPASADPAQFQVIEAGVPLEMAETNQYFAAGPVLNERLRKTYAILLDYSGSMFEAAQSLGLPGPDPLQALYEQEVGVLIDSLSPSARTALLEFHERSLGTRVVQDFTLDRAALQTALSSISIAAGDHGASPLLPAVAAGIFAIEGADTLLLPFDDADVRALILISDGRLTTPPGQITATIDLAVKRHVRVYAIGWGRDVNHEPLARLASATGGHYYPTYDTDGDGRPEIAQLAARLEAVAQDLVSQCMLTYVTLNESPNVAVRVNASLANPIPDPLRPVLTATFLQNINLERIAGDVKLGQISMTSSGVVGGTATVLVRADYLPRNINKLRFTFSSAEFFDDPVIVSTADGGLLEGWTMTNLGGGTYSLNAPAGTMLRYGDFGNLIALTFPAVAVTPFTLNLAVDNSIYGVDLEPKYFLYPDSIPIDTNETIAPAFPTARVTPSSIDLGAGVNSATLTIQNIGGSLLSAGVQLHWTINTAPAFLAVVPRDGYLASTTESDSVILTPDRTLNPGLHRGNLIVAYDGVTLNIANAITIPISLVIANPILAVSTNTVTIPSTANTGSFVVRNNGESTLRWSFSTVDFPNWLTATPAQDATTATTPVTVTFTVDRSLLTPPLTHAITITSLDGQSQTVTLTVAP